MHSSSTTTATLFPSIKENNFLKTIGTNNSTHLSLFANFNDKKNLLEQNAFHRDKIKSMQQYNHEIERLNNTNNHKNELNINISNTNENDNNMNVSIMKINMKMNFNNENNKNDNNENTSNFLSPLSQKKNSANVDENKLSSWFRKINANDNTNDFYNDNNDDKMNKKKSYDDNQAIKNKHKNNFSFNHSINNKDEKNKNKLLDIEDIPHIFVNDIDPLLIITHSSSSTSNKHNKHNLSSSSSQSNFQKKFQQVVQFGLRPKSSRIKNFSAFDMRELGFSSLLASERPTTADYMTATKQRNALTLLTMNTTTTATTAITATETTEITARNSPTNDHEEQNNKQQQNTFLLSRSCSQPALHTANSLAYTTATNDDNNNDDVDVQVMYDEYVARNKHNKKNQKCNKNNNNQDARKDSNDSTVTFENEKIII